jgi:hypothetical protein
MNFSRFFFILYLFFLCGEGFFEFSDIWNSLTCGPACQRLSRHTPAAACHLIPAPICGPKQLFPSASSRGLCGALLRAPLGRGRRRPERHSSALLLQRRGDQVAAIAPFLSCHISISNGGHRSPSSTTPHGAPDIFSLSYLLLPWRPRPACQLYAFCCVCFQLQLIIEASANLNPCLLVLLQHYMSSVWLNASKVRLSLFFSLLPISEVRFTVAFLAVLADSLREGGTDHSKWMCPSHKISITVAYES